ncbi:MAG: hydroxyacid dehydrogenase [Thermocrinis sp.]|nr:hydroxyacid dehydrogenase [Thermocrinis sp.]
MLVYVFETKEWERRYLTEVVKDIELKFSEDRLNKDTVHKYKDAEAVIVFVDSRVDREVIDQLPKLRLIITRSTGYDHIDVKYAMEKGIVVCNVPDYASITVAEYTIALMLALSRRLKETVQRTSKGTFSQEGLSGFDLSGKTLGVIGTGRIGKYVIKFAHAFDMRILAYDLVEDESLVKNYHVEYVELERLLKDSDIITIHVPYTPQAHHLINASNINLLKPTAMLINTARGPVVETKALVKVLKEGKLLGGVALDVFEGEEALIEDAYLDRSFSSDMLQNSLLVSYLAKQERVIVTPHNAYNTRDALFRMLGTVVENLRAFLEGKPKNVVHDN